MSENTKIEWTDRTWNCIRGCSRVSEGCRNCYAERMAARFSAPQNPALPFVGFVKDGKWTGRVELVPEKLAEPLSWRKPARVFVNSMSDLFHESLSDEAIAAVFGVMAGAPHHTFQVLTKRAARMRAWFEWLAGTARNANVTEHYTAVNCAIHAGVRGNARLNHQQPWPLPNVWIGVSVENQEAADERIPWLLNTPAAVRFLSCEPLLGGIQLDVLRVDDISSLDALTGVRSYSGFGGRSGHTSQQYARGIDWVIVGGESGPGARPCDVAWIRSIVGQCKAASVPVFVKQLGARPLNIDATTWSPSKRSDDPAGTLECRIGNRLVANIWPNSEGTATWHTWDERGGGGENSVDRYVEGAKREVAKALVRQQWHGVKLRDRKGGDMAEWPEDLRVREFPEVPIER